MRVFLVTFLNVRHSSVRFFNGVILIFLTYSCVVVVEGVVVVVVVVVDVVLSNLKNLFFF